MIWNITCKKNQKIDGLYIYKREKNMSQKEFIKDI